MKLQASIFDFDCSDSLMSHDAGDWSMLFFGMKQKHQLGLIKMPRMMNSHRA